MMLGCGGTVVGDQVVNVGGVLRDQMFEFGVVWGSSVKFEVWWIIKCSMLGGVMGVSNVH